MATVIFFHSVYGLRSLTWKRVISFLDAVDVQA